MNEEDRDNEQLGWFHAVAAAVGIIVLAAFAYAGVSLVVAGVEYALGVLQ